MKRSTCSETLGKKKSGLAPKKKSDKLALNGVCHRFEAVARMQLLIDMANDYAKFALLNPLRMDSQGAVRSLSIASAPYEEELFAATRVRDSTFERLSRHFRMVPSFKWKGPWGVLPCTKTHGKRQYSWLVVLGSPRSAASYAKPLRRSSRTSSTFFIATVASRTLHSSMNCRISLNRVRTLFSSLQ